MDSWVFNKIAGAVLSALLVAFGAGTLADILTYGSNYGFKPGYVLPTATASPTGGGGAAPAAFDAAQVVAMLKGASADSGREAFGKCRACHTVDKGGKGGQGPNLWGVVGRKAASSDTFANYSPALKGVSEAWSYEKLAAFLNNPAGAIPGSRMAFAGVKDSSELADIIVYLRTLSDSQVPLPQ